MAITSTEVADILGMTTADAKYARVVALLPYIQVQINDYCGGGFSRQVKEETVTFAAASSTGVKQVVKYPIVKDTVYVTSTNRGTYYFGDTQFGNVANPRYYIPSTYTRDYEVEYSTGGIYIPTTDSRIGSTYSVLVTYSFVDLYDGGKVACAKMIEQTMNQSGGIASESVGSLSRSYFGNGMDPIVKTMLAPYKRIRVV
jgi:hypothetical protein